MKHLLGVVSVVTPILMSSVVVADTRVGGSLGVLPGGKLKLEQGADSLTYDAQTAFALGGLVDFRVHQNFTVGFAPRVIFNVNSEGNNNEAAKELDLALRLSAETPVAGEAVRGYGYLAPGYSFLRIPDPPDGADQPKGLVIGVGGGMAFRVAPHAELTVELGYQLGFQKGSQSGRTTKLNTRYMHLALGVLFSF